MHKRSYSPYIWILDNDTQLSAQMLSDKLLAITLKHLIECLVKALYYNYGIRTRAIFDYKFSDKNKESTVQELFPLEDPTKILGLYKFSFSHYSNRSVKWARKCKEHLIFCRSYLFHCLVESYFRNPNLRNKDIYRFAEIVLEINLKLIKIPFANINEIVYTEWKSVPPKYRSKDQISGLRKFLISRIEDPYRDYQITKREIPRFIISKFDLDQLY